MQVIAKDTKTPSTNHLAKIKHIVMVASGKGGVGKSTTTINLALAMAATGARIGIMDADIYGPSQQAMLGIPANVKPEVVDEKYMKPIIRHSIKSMSIGYLSSEKTPMIWRGPMATSALQQLLTQTQWGELDILLIDMPPGTGDIHISVAQKFPISGAVVVTTPQEIALIDARKGIEMFNKINIPILGLVENMSIHTCSKCGHQEHIFGFDGASKLHKEFDVPLLASLPLDNKIGSDVDNGEPTVVSDPDSEITREYISLAAQVMFQLNRAKQADATAPEIRIVD